MDLKFKLIKESYTSGHSPSEVDFVDDIAVDASRRDFSINSIYYDVNSAVTKDAFVLDVTD